MKRHWTEYSDTEPTSPMTVWVHRRMAAPDSLAEEVVYNPPREGMVPGKGYPMFFVECDGFTFKFASRAEIKSCISILERKLLPRPIDISRGVGHANRHWLSRLPAHVKPWKYREKAVAYLIKALAAFDREMAG